MDLKHLGKEFEDFGNSVGVAAESIEEKSPVLRAFRQGVSDGQEVMDRWSGDVEPPMPMVPFSSKTQDALCRAYIGGVLLSQALGIECLLIKAKGEKNGGF